MSQKKIKLEIRHLSFTYPGDKHAVIRDVDLTIPGGSVTSMLGLNGSGKTTLMMLILGFLNPDKGNVIYQLDGQFRKSNRLNGAIGYLPQIENIPFDYPVTDFILLGRSPMVKLFRLPSIDDYKKIFEIQQFLELNDIADSKLHQISGGELQRVRIARTLAQEPEIILMDEPMTHLDIKHKQYLSGLMRELSNQGKIVIYSSHDPLDAIRNSDFCILLSKKYPSFAGESKELLNSKLLSKYFEMQLQISNGDVLTVVG